MVPTINPNANTKRRTNFRCSLATTIAFIIHLLSRSQTPVACFAEYGGKMATVRRISEVLLFTAIISIPLLTAVRGIDWTGMVALDIPF